MRLGVCFKVPCGKWGLPFLLVKSIKCGFAQARGRFLAFNLLIYRDECNIPQGVTETSFYAAHILYINDYCILLYL